MPSTTARTLIVNALVDIGVLSPGATPSPYQANDGLRRLNQMIQGWSLQPLTVPVVAREVFTLTAERGGPDDPYTIGPGGDFDTTRPVGLRGAGILLPNADDANNRVEVPRAVITDEAWEAIQIKGLRASQFTDVYFNPTYSDDLATINLWPVPNTTVNSLVIYREDQTADFPSLDATVFTAPGADEAMEYNLARRLLAPNGIIDQGIVADIRDQASAALATFKRGNVKLSDVGTDPALTQSQRGGYNILTGTGGGTVG